jgi:uncharacterized membrane protein
MIWTSTKAQSSPYTITSLGTLPGTSQSVATAINNQGQIVGITFNGRDGYYGYDDYGGPPIAPARYHTNSTDAQSFVYSNGQMAPIEPTGGLAMSINDSGQVVGGRYSSINNAGQYVGGPGSGIVTGIYSGPNELVNGTTTTSLPAYVAPYAINNAGQVAASQLVSGSPEEIHAGIYQGSSFRDFVPLLKNYGYDGHNSLAVAINNHGDMIINGINQSDVTVHSFLYLASTQTIVDLYKLPGGQGKIATALNDKSQAVGNSFFYSDGVIQTLTSLLPPNSGWSDLNATGINNAGQIVGQGQYNGQELAFLMSPVAVTAPEPATLAVWGLAAAAVGLRHFVRKSKRKKG